MENLPAKPQITQEDIDIFMNGRDAQERIVNLEYHYRDNFMQVYYRDENDNKCVSNVPFYPFLWATKEACRKLCNGNKNEIRANLIRYHLSCTGLDTKSLDGQPVPEIDNGYTVLFKAEQPMSYSEFKQFFKTCGNPVWKRDSSKADTPETPEEKIRAKQYLEVTPKEQFLIATGKRFFKGYGDYNGCLRMIFDLETTGLDTRRDRIEQFGIWFNRQVNYRGKKMDFHRIYDVGGETEKEKDESELENIKNFLSIIRTFKPDIITAHNGEAFDWNIIMGACQRLGTTIEALSAPYFNGESIHKEERESILKLGGEIEYYRKTVVPGCIVTDSLHAVRRAQAMDSNMLEANLKYVTKYAEMVKPNRVYVPGDKISEIYNDYEEKYAFDDKNGDWYIYEPSYDDCTDKKGIDSAPFHLYTKNKLLDGYELVTGHYIVQRYLLDDLYECDRVEHRFNTTNFLICKILPLPFEKCCTMGTAGQWKSLMLAWSYEHRLAVPMSCENRTFTGGLSRLLRTGYVSREVKFDYNSLYPSITLTWGIATRKDISGVMLKMLEYVLTKREEYKGLKKKAGKLVDAYENKLNEGVSLDETENKDYHQAMSDYAFNDAKQMQMKVLANSFFGSYGNQSVFNWGDLNCAERITCTGRQALRLMIGYFQLLEYQAIVGDTDGFNFELPPDGKYRYTDEHPYIGKGLSRETKEGKKYTKFEGDLGDFNDTYMRDFHYAPNAVNKMGCGLDELIEGGSIQIARKNYADYFPEKPYGKDVKIVGNTLKSKKMPEYIKVFIDKGIRLLLNKRGKDFIDEYYSYIEKIYNYQIPLKQIASKGKVKKTIEDYKKDCKTLTKAGQPKARQSWMELAMNAKLDVHLGETLYYINTGSSKSEADVKRVTHYYAYVDTENGREKQDRRVMIEKEYKKSGAKEKKIKIKDWIKTAHPEIKVEDEIILNCELVSNEIINSEKDFYCEEGKEYNVPKYIDQFNKRITPLLVCFDREMRGKILVTNPKDRHYFTEEECQFVSGQPNKPSDQDTFEDLMTMDDREIRFWLSHPEWDIPFLKETGMNWDEIVKDYRKRMNDEKEKGITATREAFEKKMKELSGDELQKLIEEETLPSSLNDIVKINEIGNVVAINYPDCVIAKKCDLIDIAGNKNSDENSE